jgi:hypothetical protein
LNNKFSGLVKIRGFKTSQEALDEINKILIKNGFYSDNVTKNWLPYLAIADLNKDGILDLMPQRPLDNYQGYWIIYGKGGWNFSYSINSLPEKQTKINLQISNNGKLRVAWKKLIINKPTSSTAINSWKLYMHNKPFGDKGMIKLQPLVINSLNSTITNDSVIYFTNLPYDTTYFRISVLDSNSFETPLSDSSVYSCSLPPAPVVQSKNMCTVDVNTIFCVAIVVQIPDDSLRIDIVAADGTGIGKNGGESPKFIVKVGINWVVAVEFNISIFLSVDGTLLYTVSVEKRVCVGEEGKITSKIFT